MDEGAVGLHEIESTDVRYAWCLRDQPANRADRVGLLEPTSRESASERRRRRARLHSYLVPDLADRKHSAHTCEHDQDTVCDRQSAAALAGASAADDVWAPRRGARGHDARHLRGAAGQDRGQRQRAVAPEAIGAEGREHGRRGDDMLLAADQTRASDQFSPCLHRASVPDVKASPKPGAAALSCASTL